MKLSPDLRSQYDRVLDAIAAAEAGPFKIDLLNAPVLDVWRPLISAHGHVVLWGKVSGHPHLGDDDITTSRLIAIRPDAGWARTASRWYRLGRPFTKLEADLAGSDEGADMHWFTADPHYSHGNIIRFCERPFPDLATMNARLLAECRARVQPDDDLWIPGDFTAGNSTDAQRREVRSIFHALPGRKHLIRGNHDEDWVCGLPWDNVAETADIVVDKRRLFLCHYPMITWPGARHRGLQLFGHVHQNWRGSRNSVNVGVDVWDFRPVTLSEIEQRAAGLPVNAHWDQVEPGRAWPTVLCAGCGRILDPALVSGQAVVCNGRIVVAATGETIVTIEDAMRKWLPEGRHVCPECIGGYLSVREVTLPAGFTFDEMRNRAVLKRVILPMVKGLHK